MTNSTESRTKHTPAPWSVYRGDDDYFGSAPYIVSAATKPVCQLTDGEPDNDANARLIAAAPELRAAVVGLLNGLEGHTEGLYHDGGSVGACGLCTWIGRANDLIDKLDGDA